MWQTVRINAHANTNGLKLKMYDVYQVGKSLLTISALEKEPAPNTGTLLTDEVKVQVDQELSVRHILVDPEANLVRGGPFEAIVKEYNDALLRVGEAKCVYHAVADSNQLSPHLKINFAQRFAINSLTRQGMIGIPVWSFHGLLFNRDQRRSAFTDQLVRINMNNPKC